MENYIFDRDIKVFCVAAKSFPAGVRESHETLHSAVPYSRERKYFGISWPGKNGEIIYNAAASELRPGELDHLGLKTFIIPRGEYLSATILNYMQNIPAI